jgi:hypothetical protein
VKVGNGLTRARYRLAGFRRVRTLLGAVISSHAVASGDAGAGG